MIPFNFKYILPETIEEALQAWKDCISQEENPVYYSGGTEIITLCRDQKINPAAVIDIKYIPECMIESCESRISYGTGLSLNYIIENTNHPVLKKVLEGIADHTIRNKLTLGGNIMGRLPYREAILPYLIFNGTAVIADGKETRVEEISNIFDKRIKLSNRELLLNLSLDPLKGKWFFTRKTKAGRIDYPILSACFAEISGHLRMAVSGSFSFPLRSIEAETILNDKSISIKNRALKIIKLFEDLFKSDFRSSGEYKKHLLKLAIMEALEYMETDK